MTVERPLRIEGLIPSTPIIRKIHRPGSVQPDPLHELLETTINGEPVVVECEPDPT